MQSSCPQCIFWGLFILALVGALLNRISRKDSRCPSPPTHQLFGIHLSELWKLTSPNGHKFLDQLAKDYGQVVELNLPGQTLVIVSDPMQIRRMWTSPEFIRDDFLRHLLSGLLQKSLFLFPSGKDWLRHRKILQPVFGPVNLRMGMTIAHQVYSQLFSKWDSDLRKCPEIKDLRVNLTEGLEAAIVDTFGRIAFSRDFKALEAYFTHQRCEGIDPINEVNTIGQTRLGLPPMLFTLMGRGVNAPHVKKTRQRLLDFMCDVIESKKKEAASATTSEKDPATRDILDRLLSDKTVDGDRFTDEEIIDETIGLFNAGIDTTTHTLAFVLMQLGKLPDVQDKVATEIRDILAETPLSELNYASLSKFTYLDAVIKETMRLHPTITHVTRTAKENVDVNGYSFPRTTVFIMSIMNANRDPRHWDEPEQFRPERFNDPQESSKFMAFGDGPMHCIGQKLAMLEIKLFVIYMINKFKLQFGPEQSFDTKMSITTGFSSHLRGILSLRD